MDTIFDQLRDQFPDGLAAALPRHLAVLAGKSWLRWREGTLSPFLAGRLRALGDFVELCRHRRTLQTLGPPVDPCAWGVVSGLRM